MPFKKNKLVLMLAPTPFFSDRGCHMRILNSYFRLEREGNKVILLTYPVGRNIKTLKIERVSNLLGYKKTEPGFSVYKPFLDLLMLFKCIKLMQKNKFDLIYAHLHEGLTIGIVLKILYDKKIVYDAQGSLVGELSAHGTIKKQGLVSKLLFGFEKYISNKPDEIITSTKALKEFLQEGCLVKKSIQVIEDFPDKNLFNSKIKPAKLTLPKDKKIVVYLGGLQMYKGISYLLRAIHLVDKKLHFLVMGYPVDEAKKMANELGIMDRITFTGPIKYEKAASYLKLGDIAISPKTLESGEANAKIYNYIAMELPIICFDMPETRKIQKEYPKAKMTFAKEKDVKDLAKKINGAFR